MATTLETLKARLDPANRQSAAGGEHLEHLDRIECADSFSMSVQASAFHYCSPRDSVGPWASVEIGFPSERVEEFAPYIDGESDDDMTKTVCGYVPIGVVADVIDAHGGFAGIQT